MTIFEWHKSIPLILLRTEKKIQNPTHLIKNKILTTVRNHKPHFSGKAQATCREFTFLVFWQEAQGKTHHPSFFPLYAPFCSIWCCLTVNEKLKTLAPGSALSSLIAFSLQWMYKIHWPELEMEPFNCWALESHMSSLLSAQFRGANFAKH